MNPEEKSRQIAAILSAAVAPLNAVAASVGAGAKQMDFEINDSPVS